MFLLWHLTIEPTPDHALTCSSLAPHYNSWQDQIHATCPSQSQKFHLENRTSLTPRGTDRCFNFECCRDSPLTSANLPLKSEILPSNHCPLTILRALRGLPQEVFNIPEWIDRKAAAYLLGVRADIRDHRGREIPTGVNTTFSTLQYSPSQV